MPCGLLHLSDRLADGEEAPDRERHHRDRIDHDDRREPPFEIIPDDVDVHGVAVDNGVENVLCRLTHDVDVFDAVFVHVVPVQFGQRDEDEVVACVDHLTGVHVRFRLIVADGEAYKAPFVAQDLRHQAIIAARPARTDAVERAHDAAGTDILGDAVFFGCIANTVVALDRDLKRFEIQLAQRLLGEIGGDARTIGLLIVDGEVLEVGVDALGSCAVDDLHRHLAREDGIFRIVLEVTSRERAPVQVDRGSIPAGVRQVVARRGTPDAVVADDAAHLIREVLVPGRRDEHLGGERRVAREEVVHEVDEADGAVRIVGEVFADLHDRRRLERAVVDQLGHLRDGETAKQFFPILVVVRHLVVLVEEVAEHDVSFLVEDACDDLFIRDGKDIIGDYRVPLPPYLHETITANVGTTTSKGFELQANWDAVQTKDFSYSTNVMLSYTQSKLKSFSNERYQLGYIEGDGFPSPGNPGAAQRLQDGTPIGSFYGFRYAGVDENGNILIWEGGQEGGTTKLGTDGNEQDKVYLDGTGVPKWELSWGNTFTWKNFDFSFFFRGRFRYKIMNQYEMYYGLQVIAVDNKLASAYEENAHIKGAKVICDYFLQNGNYLRLDNITVGWTPKLKTKWISNLRVYGTLKNVFTLTKYTGVDPTTVNTTGLWPGIGGMDVYPMARNLTFGVQISY